jgi:membrane protease YdiL (CAAX protease family)
MAGVRGERALVLALIGLLTVGSLLPIGAAAAAVGVVAVAVTGVAWKRRAPAASSVGLLFITGLVLSLVGVGPQQVTFVLAFAVYFAVLGRVPWLRTAGRWLTAGRIDRTVLAAGAAFAAASGLALLLWHAAARPNLQDLVSTYVPDWPPLALALGAIVFSLVNAAVEEAAYRGVVMNALDTVLGPGIAAVVLQAMAFAALHYQGGFPRGLAGVGLTFIYGVALGTLRRYASGLLVPFVTHVLTDLVIVSIVLLLSLRSS